jgi:chorismate mutase
MRWRIDMVRTGQRTWVPLKRGFPSAGWAMAEAERLFKQWRSIEKIRVVPLHSPKFQSYRREGMAPSMATPSTLTELAIRRLFVSDQVAAAKFGTGQPVDDPAREQKELNQVRQDATTRGIDPDAAMAFFQDQIIASKVVQKGLFQRWTAHPEQAPTTRPDLGQIRHQLDEITTGIMQQLVATKAVRQASPPRQVGQPEALVSEDALNHLDDLHQRALSVALQSVWRRTVIRPRSGARSVAGSRSGTETRRDSR